MTGMLFFFSVSTKANWIKTEQRMENASKTQSTQYTQSTPYTQSTITTQHTIPEGVTQDWLNQITDENGNGIFTGRTSMVNTANVTMTGEDIFNYFGWSVSTAGDVNGDGYSDVIVGARDAWKAYIFYGGSSMNNTADVTISHQTETYFGWSVSTAGDVNGDGYSDVIVGTWAASINGSLSGVAHIFYGDSIMNNTPDVTMFGEAANSRFGVSVSTAGDVNNDGYSDVIVGAYGDNNFTGRAYLYYGGAGMDSIADVTMNGAAEGNNFGWSVSTAGYVNGDVYSDVIVGAYQGNGRAYIFFGGSIMNNTPDVTMTGTVGSNFGFSVSDAGYVNGDVYSDVIVGGPAYGGYTGRAYIFYGGSNMNNTVDVTMTGEAAQSSFGYSVSRAGDVNRDGYSDVIVGASTYLINNTFNTGRAYVYHGGVSMNNEADLTMTGEAINNFFGNSVSEAGDVNGDSNPDFIIGAPGNNGETGKSYIYFSYPVSTINIKVIPEGFYNASTNKLSKKDIVKAYLRNNTSPYNILELAQAVVDSITYQGSFKFFNTSSGTYYIVIKHRNTIETWSKPTGEPYVLTTTMSYDFTNSNSKSFGNNMIQVDASPVRFGIYSGDVNQDGAVDLTDGSLIDNDSYNFVSGYVNTDLNGDGLVDLTDYTFADNNGFNFVSVVRP